MRYYFNQIEHFKNPVPLFFLCGVKYNKRNPYDDKRVVLKKYLAMNKCYSIILEENFIPVPYKKGKIRLTYSEIGLNNLHDVETLACMVVDGVFVIHESHSTAAEIALFASNECLTDKIFVLVPDEENAQTKHYSGFLSFAYESLLPKYIIFNPVVEKNIINEENIEIKTYFNQNKIGKHLGEKIDEFVSKADDNKEIQIVKSKFNKKSRKLNSYYIENDKIYFFINIQVLRYYIIALFNILEFRNNFKKCNGFKESVCLCESWFKQIMMNTAQRNEKNDIFQYRSIFKISNVINSRLDLRKAISIILYMFHATGWINIDLSSDCKKVSICKKTDSSSGFKVVYEKYYNIILKEELVDFEGI